MRGCEHDVGRHVAAAVPCDLAVLVEDHDLGERAPELDAPAHEPRWHRVVDVPDPDEAVAGDARLAVPLGARRRIGQRAQEPPLDVPRVRDDRPDTPVVPAVGDGAGPAIVLVLEVCDVGERAQRQERCVEVAVGAFDLSLDSGRPGCSTTTPIPKAPKNAATSSCRIATPPRRSRTIAASLSHTTFSGAPPRRSKHPSAAGSRSPIVRPRVNTAACAAECGSVVTNPNASRVAPLPTRIWAPVCHQSSCEISPGR